MLLQLAEGVWDAIREVNSVVLLPEIIGKSHFVVSFSVVLFCVFSFIQA